MKLCFPIFTVALMITGCSAKTILPTPLDHEPTENVYLLKYSGWNHHSLAFHRNDTLIEFTYGDWELYAKGNRGCWTSWSHMTFWTQGALGRRVVPWTEGEPIRTLFKGCVDHLAFKASSDRVSKLLSHLQGSYQESLNSKLYNRVEDVHFVKYHRSYCLFNNCNHAVEDWLEELGADVSGRIFYMPNFLNGVIRQ